MAELIEDGSTGFLVDDAAEAPAAIEKVGTLDRRVARAAVERSFTVDRMADQYLALYRRILAGAGSDLAGERMLA